MGWHYVTTDQPGWTQVYSQDQEDNAREVWNYLISAGWTENSASAVIGNFQVESYLNPGQWELYQNYSMAGSMGLGQWYPATKVSNYVGSTNHDAMANGTAQMGLLLSTPGQYDTVYLDIWGNSQYYNETGLPYIPDMYSFSQSNANIDDLTKVWAICWERPRNTYYTSSKGDRIAHANHWYNILHGSTPPTPSSSMLLKMGKYKIRKRHSNVGQFVK